MSSSLAAEYSLYPIYKEEFHHIFTEHQNHEEFKSLMLRMKVVDANGESALDVDQWEAASQFSEFFLRVNLDHPHTDIYIGFVLEKR